jgi:leucyl aminopeptidase
MRFKTSIEDPLGHACPLLILCCGEDTTDDALLGRFDQALGGAIAALFRDKEFSGALHTTKLLHTLGRLNAERLLLVGVGPEQDCTPERLRQAFGAAAQTLKSLSLKTCSFVAPTGDGLLRAAAEGFALGTYTFAQYQTKAEEKERVDTGIFLLRGDSPVDTAEAALRETNQLCAAVGFSRDLVAQPGNVATPSYLADKAQELAARFAIPCQVWDREELEQRGMGALLAVARGSRQQPRFITLDYRGAGERKKPVVLVGKGVTFDSGGISLKPREGMERMKNDMAGAAVVLGVFMAVAALKLPINVVGLIPAVENMPGGNACKPGDVVTSLSGTTVEIVNTDAEGRLVLCDALHHALSYQPAAIIDIATLTGACVVALGNHAAGLLGTDESLVRALTKAGEATGERVWALPLWEEYGDAMKSDIADLKNAGGPGAGTITAAWFLKNFVGKSKWAHLDIAGTTWEEKGRHYLPKGATAAGVRLLVHYLRGLC